MFRCARESRYIRVIFTTRAYGKRCNVITQLHCSYMANRRSLELDAENGSMGNNKDRCPSDWT